MSLHVRKVARMANEQHLALLKRGVEVWNAWRFENPRVVPNLRGADLSGRRRLFHRVNLNHADLSQANLRGAYFSEAMLYHANLSKANLENADLNSIYAVKASFERATLRNTFLNDADLDEAHLRWADLSGACLYRTSMRRSDLRGAVLARADLGGAFLLNTNLRDAVLVDCNVHGVAAWNVNLRNAMQSALVITHRDEPTIEVDSLEIAQFVYMLLNNRSVRDVIDAITSKVVLILGRFTPRRKEVLEALRDELRRRNYSPVLFDFDKPRHRDITETVSTLAHMARFVIADITDAKSIPQELMSIVPNLPSVPVQPLLLAGSREYGMFEHFRAYPWVLPVVRYRNRRHLIRSLGRIIKPAEERARYA
jgi:hypothetical protein